jgi:hypothetical protein
MFNSDEIEEYFCNAINPKYGIAERADVNLELIRLRTSIRRDASKHLHKWILLIDEGIQFLIHLSRLIGSREPMGAVRFNLWTLISRQKSLAISFRELILLGQSESSRIILRAFIESNDITISAIADADFCSDYAPEYTESIDVKQADNDYWKDNVAYGKIYPAVRDALRKADFSEKQIERLISWKKFWKTELSGAVHGGATSSFNSCLIPSLAKPEMLVGFSHGHLSSDSPMLCFIMIQELLLVSNVFEGVLKSKNMPKHLKGYPTGREYASTMASAETMQEYYYKYFNDLKPDTIDEKESNN